MRVRWIVRRQLVRLDVLDEGSLEVDETELVEFFPYNDVYVLALVVRAEPVLED